MRWALLTWAVNGYMPKLGGQLIMPSPGLMIARATMSISSSAPAPASKYSFGTLVTAARVGVPIVAVPRCRSFGEVVDDHQAELVDRVIDRPGVTALADVDQLTIDVLRAALASAGEIVG